jgi:hypothetical protein
LKASHGFGEIRLFNPQGRKVSQGRNQLDAGGKQSYVIKYRKNVKNQGLSMFWPLYVVQEIQYICAQVLYNSLSA